MFWICTCGCHFLAQAHPKSSVDFPCAAIYSHVRPDRSMTSKSTVQCWELHVHMQSIDNTETAKPGIGFTFFFAFLRSQPRVATRNYFSWNKIAGVSFRQSHFFVATAVHDNGQSLESITSLSNIHIQLNIYQIVMFFMLSSYLN